MAKGVKTTIKDQSETRVNAQGETVPNIGHVNGATYLTLKTTQKPGVVDQNVQPIISESEFYGGCWAIASVNASVYDQKGNRGVNFYLQNIQKVRDGEPLGGRARPEAEFAPISGTTESAPKSTNDLFN